MNEHSDNPPLIVLLGNIDHEGILSTITTSPYAYQKKLLDSTRANWGTIIEVLKSPSVGAVMVKLTGNVYRLLADPGYEWIGRLLLEAVASKRNIIFAYESLMDPNVGETDAEAVTSSGFFYRSKHDPPPPEIREIVIEKLSQAGLAVLAYSSNAELTVMGSQFVREVASNLLFRLYVPHGRLYSSELDKLLQLFKDYLDGTGRKGITLNKVAAEQGTSYEFCGAYETGKSLSEDFEDFSEFMNLCVTDVEKAKTMLSFKAIDPREIGRIVDRYTKEARRLTLDLTHEREMRILGIRHRLESELTDVAKTVSQDALRKLVDEAIPASANIFASSSHGLASVAGLASNVTININSQVIKSARGLILRELNGDLNLGNAGSELVQIISTYAGPKADHLINDLQQVGDAGLPESVRVTRTQQIKSFLYSLAPDIARSGLRLLEEYAKSKIH